ncbi:MAG: UDP-N-acetylmuramoyl-L-alanine--D-glutamate ligase, partial [Clostridia bacterium]|nr:UDP-N-acetylmuramoyl-L-alanine--D-glutamate ligase [Clostridia bacterium]
EPLAEPLCQHAKTVILTGNTAEPIKKSLIESPEYLAGAPEIIMAKNYAESVEIAHRIAKEGDIVLLSPASASFDAFRNFEERGRFFKDLVNKL